MNGKPSPQVLRDVIVQGRWPLERPRAMHSGQDAGAGAGANVPARPRSPVETQAAEAQEARRRGYEDGFAEGKTEGRALGAEEARQSVTQAAAEAAQRQEAEAGRTAQMLAARADAACQARIARLDGLIAAVPPQVVERLEAVEDDMLALCFDVVCRVLGRDALRPEAIRAQLGAAVDALRHRPLVAVHLHPDDLALLQADPAPITALVGRGGVEWRASAEVTLGGCILQSPDGGLDARLETQLDALRDLLLQGRSGARDAVP